MTEKPQSIKPKPSSSLGIITTVLVWLMVGVLLHVFWRDLLGILFVLAEGVRGLYWCTSFILLLWLLLLLSKKRNTVVRFTIFIMIAFFISGSVALFRFGMRYGILLRFYFYKPDYERVLTELQQNPSRDYQNERLFYYGNGVIVDQGPPQRIAFQLPGGLLDNFQAVVYDPSGYVMKANQFKADWSNWNDPELKPVKELFGGEMFRCDPIESVWYLCWFT